MSDGAKWMLWALGTWAFAAALLLSDVLIGWDGFTYIAVAEGVMGALFLIVGAYCLARG